MNKKWIAFLAWVALTAALSVAALQMPQARAAATAPPTQLPADLTRAITTAVRTRSILGEAQFAVTAVQMAGDWVLVAVGALDGPTAVEGYIGSQESGALLLASKQNGVWQVALPGEKEFDTLLAQAPDALLSQPAKVLLGQSTVPASANASQTVSYKWPWPADRSWRWLQGWHSRALDIGTDGGDRRVLASADGVITYLCKGDLGAALKVRDADGIVLEYWHIDSALLSSVVHLGATVTQGQWLGTLRPGTWTDSTACGTQYTSQSPNSSHVHWVLPTDRTFTVEGWSITHPNSTFSKDGQTRTCNGGCWSSALFFTSSNQPSNEPNPATPTPTDTATSTATPTPTSTPELTASLAIEPASIITQTGTLVTMSLMLSSEGIDLSAVELSLSYDPALIGLEHISPTGLLTNVVITGTHGLAIISGTFITAQPPAPMPMVELGMRTQLAGLSAIRITTATLMSTEGHRIAALKRDGQVFAVLEWPLPRVYLPFVTRDAVNTIVPPSTPTSTPTLTATSTLTHTSTSTTTPTSTATPMPTESSTSTSTSTILPATPTMTSTPLSPETPTPTSTLVDAR